MTQQKINFRRAIKIDIESIAQIYSDIHTCEEAGQAVIGWVRGIYPTKETAQASLLRGDLFVMEVGSKVVGSAIINRQQVAEYKYGKWEYDATDDEVMVLHTLVIAPEASGKGYGKMFVDFYERYALESGCSYLRMDTNEKNIRARKMYEGLGYKEIGTVPCEFNGIKGVGLVLLEKKL